MKCRVCGKDIYSLDAETVDKMCSQHNGRYAGSCWSKFRMWVTTQRGVILHSQYNSMSKAAKDQQVLIDMWLDLGAPDVTRSTSEAKT